MDARDKKLADALQALEPHSARVSEPSETRAYVRANFDTILAARERGVTWAQITKVLTDIGVKAPDGSPLQWRVLKSLYHAERYAMGGRPKRRKRKPPLPRQPAPTQTREDVPFDPNDGTPDDKPTPRFQISRPKG
jgi:hypothetical protein